MQLTVQKRNYILKENREGKTVKSKVLTLNEQSVNETTVDKIIGVEKNKLFPTDIGEIVTKFLVKHFSKILDYSFTATVEDEFDLIAEGKKVWNEMIENFYSGFISKVNDVDFIQHNKARVSEIFKLKKQDFDEMQGMIFND